MKKILLFASALAGLFLAGSCQRENLEPQQTEQQVTFTIEAPAALQTKAIADGLNVDELIYEVWITETQNAETLDGATRLYQAKTDMKYDETNKRMKANITLDLVNDQNFTILFWAQKKDIGVYNTEWLNAVTYTDLKENAYAANDYRLDAFYSKAYVVDCQTATPTVVLRRPFAQVNLCTLNSKDAALVDGNYNMTLVSSEMRLDAVPTVFNVATSEASNLVAMDFLANAVPSGVDQKITVNGQEYYYAGMNYVFAGTNFELTYDIQAKLNGTVDVNINNTIPSVPLKENYRTNIVGNLLTSQTDFEIIVDAAFNEPAEVVEVVSVSTATELVQAIEAATTDEGESTSIKLEGDINLNDLFAELTKSGSAGPQSITVPAGKDFTLDLNGYSLTGVDEGTANFGLITNKGNLTIANSSSNPSRIALIAVQDRGWNAYSSVISNNPGGNLLVKGNVVIEHLGGTAMAYGIDNLTNGRGTSAIATVDGATVKSTYRAIRQFLNGTEAVNSLTVKAGSVIKSTTNNKSIWMQDPSKNANTGSLVVEEGAELYGNVYISATEGSTEWPVSASVAASALKDGSEVEISPKNLVGYNVALNDGVYVFERTYSKENGVYTVYTAAGLVAVSNTTIQGGESVVLAADIDLTGVEFNGLNAFNPEVGNTFDGNGFKVSNWTNESGASDMGFIKNWVGTIKNVTIEGASLKTAGRSAVLAGKVYANIENCHVVNSTIEDSYWACGVIAGLYNSGSIKNCSVDGCSVKSNGGVGGIVGVINEAGGERKIENCTVKNTTVNNTGVYGEGYSGALVAGMFNADGATYKFINCTLENNTKKGQYVGDLFYSAEGETVYVDDVQQ